MDDWILNGVHRREKFENGLDPENMSRELFLYQKYLGKDFGIKDFLYLQDIRAKALIAEAINDAPEFLMDHVGRLRNSPMQVPSITGELAEIAEVLERHID